MIDQAILDKISAEVSRIYLEIEVEILSEIAKELNKGKWLGVFDWRLEKLRQMGKLDGTLTQRLARSSTRKANDIDIMIADALERSLKKDDVILHKMGITTTKNAFQTIAEAAIANARNGINLTNTTALQAASQTWVQVVNEVYLRTLTGSTTLNDSVALATRRLGRHGLMVEYVSASGRVTRTSIEAAMRRNIVTSVGQAAAKITEARCDEYEVDLVEVSQHMGSRPEHAAWQGKVYSLRGKTPGYELLSIATRYGEVDGLGGVNCRHTFYPYHDGAEKKQYNQKENKEVYEETQKQRYLERNIRSAKREASVCRAAGDSEGSANAQARMKAYQSKMREFIDNSGLTRQYPREQIYT